METRFVRMRTNAYDYIALEVVAGSNSYLVGCTFTTDTPLYEIEDCTSWEPFELFHNIDRASETCLEYAPCDANFITDIYGHALAEAYIKSLNGECIIYSDDEKGFDEFVTNQMTDDLDDIRDSWFQLDTDVDGYRVDWFC